MLNHANVAAIPSLRRRPDLNSVHRRNLMMHSLRHRRTRERLGATPIASSVRSIMSKSMWIFVPALCAAPLASAEIFKCVGKNGTDLYQHFPCQFDSLGLLPSNPPSAKT